MMLFRQNYRRFLGIFAVCSCLFIAYRFLTTESTDNADDVCPDNAPLSLNEHICFKKPHVFFVETSGSATLNVRQACAIESAARHHPSMEIYVLMTPSSPLAYSHNLIKKINTLQNIHLQRISIDVFVHDSPLFKWFTQGKWKKSEWKISHMSDALRFLLLWKYGGIYLDMDTVTLRSLEHLRNSAVTEDWNIAGTAILIFDKNHELIRRCVFDFASNYNPLNFIYNGPGIFTDNIKKYCDVNSIDKVSSADCGIKILPPEAAFPVFYDKWKNYFIQTSVKNVSAAFNSSYVIHVWNKLSHVYKLKVGSGSLYELAIKQHCPLAYEYAQEDGYI